MRTLNKVGQESLRKYVLAHTLENIAEYFLNSELARNAWCQDIENKAQEKLPVAVEIGRFLSKTKNPVLMYFYEKDFDENIDIDESNSANVKF